MRPLATGALVVLVLAAGGAPAARGSSFGPEALDARFGSCGVRQAPGRAANGSGQALNGVLTGNQRIALAADGSALVAGAAKTSREQDNLVLERLLADGAADRSFGDAGRVVASVPLRSSRQRVVPTGLAIGGDGKIVLGATIDDRFNSDSAAALLARFNPDGTLDASFGSGGFVVEKLGNVAAEVADIALAPDGAILAAGVARGSGIEVPEPEVRGVVARFTPAGARDAGFGKNGLADPGLGSSFDVPVTVRLLGDGRILVGGEVGRGFALARLMPNGDLDRTFGDDGVSLSSPPADAGITTMELDGQGRIVAAGTARNVNGNNQLALARYLRDGGLDRSFGEGGFTIDPSVLAPLHIALLSDGRILVPGSTQKRTRFASGVLRYRADGTRDVAFGSRGALTVQGPGTETNDVVVARDGTALAAQTVGERLTVARFVIGQPAFGAIVGQARVCSVSVAVKSITRLLRPQGKSRSAFLLVGLQLVSPGAMQVKATVEVGGQRAKLGATSLESLEAGPRAPLRLKVRPGAAKLLRGARKAQLEVSARGADGGAVTTVSQTLGP